MNNSGIAVGLDIGTTKIVAMVGRKNAHGKIEILGVGRSKSLGVHRGVVNNISQTIESIQEAVSQAEAASGYKIKDVTVGIAGQHIRSLQHNDYITRSNHEEVISEKDLKNLTDQVHTLAMLPGEEIIHVLPQEFKIDGEGEITHPIGMYGNRLEANFHVVVGQVTSIKNIARCVKSAGLNLAGITLEPIASSNATLSDEEKEAGVAIIDMGGGTSDIAIFKDDIIRHTSVIPFGGNVITEDIKAGCSIIERHAEKLKTKYGKALPQKSDDNNVVTIPGLRGRPPKEISFKMLSQIIHARVTEILEQAYLELRNYGCDEQRKKLIGGIVLTGGGAKLQHLRQLTEYITGHDVRIGYSNEHVVGKNSQDYSGPEYATAVGLLMKALNDLPHSTEINTAGTTEDMMTEEPIEKENTARMQEMQPKTEKAEAKEDTIPEKKAKNRSTFINRWTDKFIQMINETE